MKQRKQQQDNENRSKQQIRMTTPHFLVTALVVISQFVTVDLIVIQLSNTPFAENDKPKPIARHASVYLQCSRSPEPGRTRWTFIRPADHMLVTTFSDTLKIKTFVESHVGNYQCRVFRSSGTVIWRSITLCLANSGKKTTHNESCLPGTSKSTGVQVIKFNLLQKSDIAAEEYGDSELTDLENLNSREEISFIRSARFRLECPFDETKNSSLIWMVDRMLKHGKLEEYNKGPVRILKGRRAGQYDCLVGNSYGYVRHRFLVKASRTDIDVGLVIGIPCVVLLLFAATGALIFHLQRSKRGPLRRRIPLSQPSTAINLTDRPTSYLDLLDQEEVSRSMEICSESDIESTGKFDRETHENAEYSPWEVRPDNLKLDDILRQNNFYTLYRARLVNFLPERSINVVVKMSRAGSTDSGRLTLVSEMEIMKSVGRHTNVVGLLGTGIQTEALFFVMEFAEHGNLRDYLRERGSSLGYEYNHESESEIERLPLHIDLVSYARQVAMGMDYLSSRGCVHEGLQTKRVLISEGGILKIADYATKKIRRDDFQAVARNNNQLSVRWMAPETLFRGIYTTEANVWSYGILLWEIMTFAATPYPLILTTEEIMARLKLGYFMENPKCCPKDIYKLMKRCWNENPARRPRFDQLVADLDGMLKNLSDQLNRSEHDNYQQEEYADAACERLRKLNYDSEYADVGHVIGRKIAPA